MSPSVEIDRPGVVPEITKIPEVVSIPKEIESLGVTTTPSQQNVVLPDPTLNQPTQSPVQPIDPSTTFAVPAVSLEQLEEMQKGSIDDASSWRAMWFIRMIHKAVAVGKNILFGQKNGQLSN